MRGRPWALAVLALAAALDCTAPRGGPGVARVVPARIDGAADAEVQIEGSGFEALVATDFGDGRGTLDAGFTAWLTPSGGGPAVPLPDVSFATRELLRATVPGGLPHALYDLALTDPAGRTGFLAGALRVVSPPGAFAAFQVAPILAQRAGGSFTVAISAVDADGVVVDGFEGAVTLSDETGTLAPSEASAFVAGELRVSVVVQKPAAADFLAIADAAGHVGRSSTFAVRPGLPATVAFGATPLSGPPGECLGPFQLEVFDRLGNATHAEAAVRARLATAPPAVQLFLDEDCRDSAGGELTIKGGDARAALWLKASEAGPLTLRARPEWLPAAFLEWTVGS
jgi:hypothetical protein